MILFSVKYSVYTPKIINNLSLVINSLVDLGSSNFIFRFLFQQKINLLLRHRKKNEKVISTRSRVAQWVGLPSNSYKPITNTAWVRARLYKLQKECTRLAAASDTVYQLLSHGRWFSLRTLASSTAKTGRHDIAEILLWR
jgi:hypothetical protein